MKKIAVVVVAAAVGACFTAAASATTPTEPSLADEFTEWAMTHNFGVVRDAACAEQFTDSGTTHCYGIVSVGEQEMVVGASVMFNTDGAFHWEGPFPAVPPPTTVSPAEMTAPASGDSSFGSGTWLVGVEIPPGIYRATVPEEENAFCSWSRLSGLSGEDDDKITGDYTTEGGQTMTVEIQQTDVAFQVEGCGTWTKIG